MAQRTCRVIPFGQEPRRPRRRAPRRIGTSVAAAILQVWGVPETTANLDAIEGACAVPIAQLQTLSASLPRWICADPHAEVGERIREA